MSPYEEDGLDIDVEPVRVHRRFGGEHRLRLTTG